MLGQLVSVHRTQIGKLNRVMKAMMPNAVFIGFLYDFRTGDIWGPFHASSRADCYERHAWGGKFAVQVRVAKSSSSRKGNLLAARRSEFLISRGLRPPHVLEGPLVNSLFSWIVQDGTNF
jgi:hypothetical protein